MSKTSVHYFDSVHSEYEGPSKWGIEHLVLVWNNLQLHSHVQLKTLGSFCPVLLEQANDSKVQCGEIEKGLAMVMHGPQTTTVLLMYCGDSKWYHIVPMI